MSFGFGKVVNVLLWALLATSMAVSHVSGSSSNTHSALLKHRNQVFYNAFTFYATKTKNWWYNQVSGFINGVSGWEVERKDPQFDVDISLHNPWPTHGETQRKDLPPIKGHVVLYASRLDSPNVLIPELCELSKPNMTNEHVETSLESQAFDVKPQIGVVSTFGFVLHPGATFAMQTNQSVTRDGLWLSAVEICVDNRNQMIHNIQVMDSRLKHHRHQKKRDRMQRQHYNQLILIDSDVQIVGRNAYGYLNGELYYSIPVTCFFIGVFIVLSSLWIRLLIKYHEYVIKYHYLLLGALYLVLFEATIQVILLSYTNARTPEGDSESQTLEWIEYTHVLSKVFLNTYVRILFCLLSLGVGMTRFYHELSRKHKVFIFVFNIIYAALCALFHFKQLWIHLNNNHTQSHDNDSGNDDLVPLLFNLKYYMMALSLCDSVIIYYILNNVVFMFEILKRNSQFYKLSVYTQMCGLLVAVMGVSFVLILAQIYLFDVNWVFKPHPNYLIFYLLSDGFWRLLCCVVVTYICFVVFIPNVKSKLLVVSDEVPNKDTDASGTNDESNGPHFIDFSDAYAGTSNANGNTVSANESVVNIWDQSDYSEFQDIVTESEIELAR